ncbi:MAG: hypothetical protein ACE5WD_05700 [Candidatus Aminicenantia bacterium]
MKSPLIFYLFYSIRTGRRKQETEPCNFLEEILTWGYIDIKRGLCYYIGAW